MFKCDNSRREQWQFERVLFFCRKLTLPKNPKRLDYFFTFLQRSDVQPSKKLVPLGNIDGLTSHRTEGHKVGPQLGLHYAERGEILGRPKNIFQLGQVVNFN